jgi:hypothetical protein
MEDNNIKSKATPHQVMGIAINYSRSVIKFDGQNYRLWRKIV